jgi:uncharacterized protein YcnI
MKTRNAIAAMTAVAALAVPAAAQAHVTVNPRTATSGSYSVMAVRVPNHEAKRSTVKVKVTFPAGFYSVFYEPNSSWKVKMSMRKLAVPVQGEYGPITEEVGSMTWTGSGKGLGLIRPDQFREFRISTQIPTGLADGTKLSFPAIQYFNNKTRTDWTGLPDSDTPAPQVTVVAG